MTTLSGKRCYLYLLTPPKRDSIPKLGSKIEESILNKINANAKILEYFISKNGRYKIYYTRKLSGFVQILDFIPSITDEEGNKRFPSELKDLSFSSKDHQDSFLCVLNSSLFYWLLSIWSDCRNLNKREVLGAPFDYDKVSKELVSCLKAHADNLMNDFKNNSEVLQMNYEKLGTLNIQCIYPKHSKHIIDNIDKSLSDFYSLTDEELDFIINYDIKYRMGKELDAED